MTYREFYNEVIAVATDRADLVEFAEKAIATLDKKNDNRKSGNSKSAVANAENRAKVIAVMTDPNKIYTAKEIAEACGFSTQRASGILGQLVKANEVTASDYSPTGKKKDTVKGYSLASAEANEAPETDE